MNMRSGSDAVDVCAGSCPCATRRHDPRLVVVTGGPGAGKTAGLEMARRSLCGHVVILPEAAGIVFGGGFPRLTSLPARRAAQRAIFCVQRQLERLHLEHRTAAVVLCDRGTLDGIAYWPGGRNDFETDMAVTVDAERARYAAVIHLRTPDQDKGYDHSNPLRTEDPDTAAEIDARIADAWHHHPNRTIVDATVDFPTKAQRALGAIAAELPACCIPEYS